MTATKFFTFQQNNSGGKFQSPAAVVIVEAEDARAADELFTRSTGVDPSGDNDDCPCCGPRWCSATLLTPTDAPALYGVPIDEVTDDFTARLAESDGVPFALVVNADGSTRLV